MEELILKCAIKYGTGVFELHTPNRTRDYEIRGENTSGRHWFNTVEIIARDLDPEKVELVFGTAWTYKSVSEVYIDSNIRWISIGALLLNLLCCSDWKLVKING